MVTSSCVWQRLLTMGPHTSDRRRCMASSDNDAGEAPSGPPEAVRGAWDPMPGTGRGADGGAGPDDEPCRSNMS